MSFLTSSQIQQIAQYLIEDHGSSLPESQLVEEIGLVLEDIAGFELASDNDKQSTIQQIRSTYHDAESTTKAGSSQSGKDA